MVIRSQAVTHSGLLASISGIALKITIYEPDSSPFAPMNIRLETEKASNAKRVLILQGNQLLNSQN